MLLQQAACDVVITQPSAGASRMLVAEPHSHTPHFHHMHLWALTRPKKKLCIAARTAAVHAAGMLVQFKVRQWCQVSACVQRACSMRGLCRAVSSGVWLHTCAMDQQWELGTVALTRHGSHTLQCAEFMLVSFLESIPNLL